MKDLKSLNADFSGQCLLLHYTEAPNFGAFVVLGGMKALLNFYFTF
ncbi:MAG: hypothetical protein NZ743_02800 [Pseudomonadales bacterium]|nr:hypothetical protein [Pseudomonadales bacterium]